MNIVWSIIKYIYIPCIFVLDTTIVYLFISNIFNCFFIPTKNTLDTFKF